MITKLDRVEVRVLGVLLEKEKTTPDYYPLSVNAVKVASNQKSNREPVMELGDNQVMDTLSMLDRKAYIMKQPLSEARTLKYAHRLKSLHDFSDAEVAILCVLFLRGPQTIGELRTRTQRMFAFEDLAQVQQALAHLLDEDFGPFVCQLPKQAGSSANRYAHLFSGEVAIEEVQRVSADKSLPESSALATRVTELENQVNDLIERLTKLESK